MSLRKWALAGLIFFVVSTVETVNAAWGASLSDIDAQIAAEERRRKELDQKLESYRNSIRQMKVKEDDMLVRIDRSQQATEKAKQEMTVLELQIKKLQGTITVLNDEMEKTNDRISELAAGLKQRLVDISKYGTSEELLLIVTAESAHEVLDSAYLMRKMAEYDQFLIEQLHDKKQEIELSRKTQEDHRDRLRERSMSLEQERRNYNSTIKQTNTYLDDIRRQKALAERAAREMEEAQKAVGNTIIELMRQKKARDEAAKKAGRGAGSMDYLKDRIARGRGSMFDWPINPRGPISSPFGQRVHPVFKTRAFHSGIDIASPRGTPVKAAAPGEVLFEGWMRGYGQVIIIDHGRNYSTVYAHMSSTRVKDGAVVGAGATIGAVGDTGTTTGYHLHFEVRVGSSAKNPLDYLKP
jgi:murein DD-endopeptidase MepM/ murein hydrolase activator NlpD